MKKQKMTSTDNESNLIHILYREYQHFVDSKGIRRMKAVEWAEQKFTSLKFLEKVNLTQEALLLKVGWETFIGLGFYSGVLQIINNHKSFELKFQGFALIIEGLIKDIIDYTNVGYFISLGSDIHKTDNLRYARVDDSGNIFIYPADAEELIVEIEDNLYAEF